MKVELKIPSLGESISEVTIGQILSPSGTIVKVDTEILEMETDKVNQLLNSPQEGKITLHVKTGETVAVGEIIGFIEQTSLTAGFDKTEEKQVEGFVEAPLPEKLQIIPNAISNEKGLRYKKTDFIEELHSHPEKNKGFSVEKPIAPQEMKIGGRSEQRKPMSTIRKVIAKRLVDAHQSTASLTTFNEVDLGCVIGLRKKYQEEFTEKNRCKLGFMSFFVKAVVSSLEAFPSVNSYIDGDEIVHREYYDIGVAIGTEKGVIVPVIRDANLKSFAEIEQSIDIYAKNAREGKIELKDLQGAGFTITNGGTYGSLLSTPILIPPQCAILGMHKIEKRAVVIEDEITIRSMMYLALTYDHRLIDGKEAVSFLVHVKEILEDPSRLMLEI